MADADSRQSTARLPFVWPPRYLPDPLLDETGVAPLRFGLDSPGAVADTPPSSIAISLANKRLCAFLPFFHEGSNDPLSADEIMVSIFSLMCSLYSCLFF